MDYIEILKAALPPSRDFQTLYNAVSPQEWAENPREAALKAFIKTDMFDGEYYLDAYPDILAAGFDPLWHFVNHGIYEGRSSEPLDGYTIHQRNNAREVESGSFKAASETSISVMIPAYNVDGYLGRAVKSILTQKHQNVEIIIYDDASTDNTWQVASELAEKFPQIRAIKGEVNRGESHGRNECLAAARGRYCTFIDGDDYYINRNFLLSLLDIAQKERADLVISPYKRIASGRRPSTDICKAGVFTGMEAAQIFLDRGFGTHGCAAKLYKTDLVKTIHVNEFGYSEDVPFVLEALLKSKRVAVTSQPGYMYDQNPSSSWRPLLPTPLHFYSSLRTLLEITWMSWKYSLNMKTYLEIWVQDHGKRLREYLSNASNMDSACGILDWFDFFKPFLLQLSPELGFYYELARKPGRSQILPSRYRDYVALLQGRLLRFVANPDGQGEKLYAIWAQHLGNGGLERVATQMGQALSNAGRVCFILDEPEKTDYAHTGETIKADFFDPVMHRVIRKAERIIDLHWKDINGSYPLADYAIQNFQYKYVPTVHSTNQCDAYYGVPARLLEVKGKSPSEFPAVICVSESVQKHLENKYGELTCSTVLHNPIEFAACKNAESLKRPFAYILFAGRLNVTQHKGIDLLLQAWNRVRTRAAGIKLMLTGAGQLDENLVEYIRRERLEDTLEINPFADNIYSYMKGAIFTVVPSRWEGFGNVTVESLACGTPVLASAVGIAPEVIVPEENGLLIEPGDVNSLEKGLVDMLELYQQISVEDCLRSIKKFDLSRYGEKLLNAIS